MASWATWAMSRSRGAPSRHAKRTAVSAVWASRRRTIDRLIRRLLLRAALAAGPRHRRPAVGGGRLAPSEPGATVVEAYPVEPDSPSCRFMGFESTFAAAGFQEVGTAGTRQRVMRLRLDGQPCQSDHDYCRHAICSGCLHTFFASYGARLTRRSRDCGKIYSSAYKEVVS